LRPAKHLVEKLARLADQGTAQIFLADEPEVDERLAEQLLRAVVALLQDDGELVARDETLLDEVAAEAELVGRSLSAGQIDEALAKRDGDLDLPVRDLAGARLALELQHLKHLGERDHLHLPAEPLGPDLAPAVEPGQEGPELLERVVRDRLADRGGDFVGVLASLVGHDEERGDGD